MSERIPFTKPAAWPTIRPGRFAATMETGSPDGCGIALLGMPDDLGVRLNGGRPGAAQGPGAFRAALATFGTTFDLATNRPLSVRVFDAGDVEPVEGSDETALLGTHARVAAAVRALDELGCLVVGVGGGHDLALPCVAAVAGRRGHALGGINVDAHLDVREKVGSGMAFRRLITDGHVDPRAFIELGLGRFVNDQGDVAWLRAQGATLTLATDLVTRGFSPPELLARTVGPGGSFLSVDLDGIDATSAPGVSASAPHGVSVHDAARLAEAAGRHPRIFHFDIMELCPPHDTEGHTARVAALLFLSFVAGWSERPR